MKNRISLLLMEQLVAVLVFALSAAVCLQIFAQARTFSREAALTDEAVILALNTAEVLKATGGDRAAAHALTSDPYRLEILSEASGIPDFSQVQILVYSEENLVFTLRTGWQEVDTP